MSRLTWRGAEVKTDARIARGSAIAYRNANDVSWYGPLDRYPAAAETHTVTEVHLNPADLEEMPESRLAEMMVEP